MASLYLNPEVGVQNISGEKNSTGVFFTRSKGENVQFKSRPTLVPL